MGLLRSLGEGGEAGYHSPSLAILLVRGYACHVPAQLLEHQMQLEGRVLSRERTRPFFQRRRRVMFPSPRSAPALVHSLGG